MGAIGETVTQQRISPSLDPEPAARESRESQISIHREYSSIYANSKFTIPPKHKLTRVVALQTLGDPRTRLGSFFDVRPPSHCRVYNIRSVVSCELQRLTRGLSAVEVADAQSGKPGLVGAKAVYAATRHVYGSCREVGRRLPV